MKDPYVYQNSNILKNRANIRDEKQLKKMEADYTVYRLSELVVSDFESLFDCKSFRKVHYQIFQDVYEWAGKFRTIDIEKPEPILGEISIEYSEYKNIAKEIEYTINEMSKENWNDISVRKKAEKLSDYMARLWKIHPYRDGNTRSVVTFCALFIEAQGSYLDSSIFKDNAFYMRTALVAATAIFQDLGDLRQVKHLFEIVYNALQEGREFEKSIINKIENAECIATKNAIRKVAILIRKQGTNLTKGEIREILETE